MANGIDTSASLANYTYKWPRGLPSFALRYGMLVSVSVKLFVKIQDDLLKKDHLTKAGIWAKIVVNDGKLRYCVDALHADAELSQNHFGIVVPEVPHRVEPVGMVGFFVEFYRSPN
jgi:tellurite resistance-related uncharacterized protein